MKIQVVIEATSIQEYTEAIQALAAGYTVQAPVINNVAVESAKIVDFDEVKEAIVGNDKTVKVEEAPAAKRNREKRKATAKAEETPKEEKSTTTPKAEEKTDSVATETSEQSKETTEAPKYGFPAVKLIASKLHKIPGGKDDVKFLLEKYGAKKLSDLKEENYDEFHAEVSQAIADHDGKTPSDDVSKSGEKNDSEVKDEKSESKEVTLEMIRGRAKQISGMVDEDDDRAKNGIRAILKEYNAPSLTKLKKEVYEDFYVGLANLAGQL